MTQHTAATDYQKIPRVWLFAPLALLMALLATETTGIDHTISGWVYDAGTQTFPLRQNFLFDTVLHHWTKYVVILTTLAMVATFALTWVLPALRRWRRRLLFLALAMSLAPLTVTALKHLTDRPCPWDIVEFGGNVPYTHLFETREQPHARGLCFPAGHASTGFALMAFFFVARRSRRDWQARGWLAIGITAGLVLGFGRIAQGAHFLSHVLWSGLVCWLVMLALYALLLAQAHAGPAENNISH